MKWSRTSKYFWLLLMASIFSFFYYPSYVSAGGEQNTYFDGGTVSGYYCEGYNFNIYKHMKWFYKKPPVVQNISNKNVTVNEFLIIQGKNFGNSSKFGSVYFAKKVSQKINDRIKIPAASWNNNKIKVLVPKLETGTYECYVTTPAGKSNVFTLTVEERSLITTVNPDIAGYDGRITIQGKGFNKVTSVKFTNGNYVFTATPKEYSMSQIVVTIPKGVIAGDYLVTVVTETGVSNAVKFTVGVEPKIISVNPYMVHKNGYLVIYGANMALGSRTPTVKFGKVTGKVTIFSATKIQAIVPEITEKEAVIVVNNGFADSNGISVKITN